jgi:nuclear pore complex protein Nup62
MSGFTFGNKPTFSFGSQNQDKTQGVQGTSAPSTSLFGASTLNTTSTFGSKTTAVPNSTIGSNPTGNVSGGGLFGSTNTPGQAPAGNLFGGSATPATTTGGSGMFGSTNTPGQAPAGNLFGGSATPAATTGGSGMFGSKNTPGQAPAGNLFGGSATPAATTGGSGMFGSTNTPGQAPAGNLFGGTATPAATTGGSGMFGSTNTPGQAPAGNLFGGSATPAATTGGSGMFGSTNTPGQAPAGNLFGGTATPAANTGVTGLTGKSQAPSTGLFGKVTTNSTLQPAKSENATLGGLSATNAVATAASTTAPAAKGLFGNVPSVRNASPAVRLSNTLASQTPSGGVSGNTAATVTLNSNVPPATPGPLKVTDLDPKNKEKTGTVQQSTAIPPANLSILKNKSLEDIVNKWNSELDLYTREFHSQAIQIQKWDNSLIQNGTLIMQLYKDLTETEQFEKEIDMNLEYIQAQQNDLENVLSTYSTQITALLEKQGRK